MCISYLIHGNLDYFQSFVIKIMMQQIILTLCYFAHV